MQLSDEASIEREPILTAESGRESFDQFPASSSVDPDWQIPQNPAFYEEETKKHEIPEHLMVTSASDEDELDDNSIQDEFEENNQDAMSIASPLNTMDNSQQSPEVPEQEPAKPDQSDNPAQEENDVDILSMLDLKLDTDKFVSEPPREISEANLQPTDWISELVPGTDELPTMADMLPEPTPAEPEDLTGDMLDNKGETNVVEMLFGDTNQLSAEPQDDGKDGIETLPSVQVPELNDLESDVDELSSGLDGMDIFSEPDQAENDLGFEPTNQAAENIQNQSWLDDAMSDISLVDDSNGDFGEDDLGQVDLPDWMNLADTPSEDALQIEPSGTEDESFDNDDDALTWLTDDSDDLEMEPQPENHDNAIPQTRDLSQSPIAKELAAEAEEDAENESLAVQADLPNWIKQMAPNAGEESVGLADEASAQMDDIALSEILSSLGDESEIEDVTTDLSDAEIGEVEHDSIETTEVEASVTDVELEVVAPIIENEAEELFSENGLEADMLADFSDSVIEDVAESEFGWMDSELSADSEFLSDDQTAEVGEAGEELVLDAIHAIESEIEEIKNLEVDNDEVPVATEWLEPNPMTTKDLPDWLQQPQTDNLDRVSEEAQEPPELTLDQSEADPAEAIDDIIAENVSTDLESSPVEALQDLENAEDPLAQFDWGDVDGIFDTPVEGETQSSKSFDWLAESKSDEISDIVPVEETFSEAKEEFLDNPIIGVPHDDHDEEIEFEEFFESGQDADSDTFTSDDLQDMDQMDLLDQPVIDLPTDERTPSIDLESSYEPLMEFEDETDVFSAVRDLPPVNPSLGAESLNEFVDSEASLEEMPAMQDDFSLDSENSSADDFFDSLAKESGEDELPSWANELAPPVAEPEIPDEYSSSNPLSGLENIVDVAPSLSNQASDIQNLHAPQIMEPRAHRKHARLAAQAAGTVPISDPTQPVVVPKERQKYQPRFNPSQFDGREAVNKQKRNRQIGFLVVAGILALGAIVAYAIPTIISMFSS